MEGPRRHRPLATVVETISSSPRRILATPPRGRSPPPDARPARTPAGVPMTTALPTRRLLAWRNAIFVIFALSGISIASWVARLPAVRDQLGIDTAQVGLLIFAMAAGSVVGLIAAPPLMARIGARAGMVVVLCLVAAGLVGIGSGTGIAAAGLVAVSLAVFGFGNGAVDVMMNVEGAAAERAIGKTLMPLMHAFFSFGTVAGAGIGALASWLAVPVPVHLAIMAVVIVVAAFVAVRFVPEGAEAAAAAAAAADTAAHDTATTDAAGLPAAGATPAKPPFRERLAQSLSVWRDLRLLAIGVIMLGMAFAEGSANDWLAIAVVDGYDQSNTTGAIAFGVFTVSMTLGRVAGGPVLDRFGRVPVLRVSAALGVLGLVAFIFAPVPWVAFVGAAFWALGCSLGFPVGMSAAADTDDPKLSAARVSAVAIIGYVAFLVGPPVIGLLGHEFGILNALLVVLVLVVLAGLASPAAREPGRRPAATHKM
ncbi:MFS transporter [Herbiconiux liangxiaofengii]|uniref:MFS transporter n=1 Tax=Herbiconiux liangxiaofengii TaxID=3342795 RepID=UPI0035B88FB5